MKKYNPLKILLDIESGELQSKPKEIISCIFVIGLYFALVTIYMTLIACTKFENKLTQISFTIIVSLLLCIFTLVVYKIISCYESDQIVERHRKITIKMIIYTVILTLGFVFFMNIIILIVPKHINITPRNSEMYENNILFAIIYMCVIAPFCEELVMRGIVLGGLLKKYDYRIAIIISALLFGAMHCNKSQFIVGTIFGILVGILYAKYKSLILCMIVHCIDNSITGIWMVIIKENMILSSVCSVVGLLIIIAMFKLLNKEDKKRKENTILIGEYMYVE